MAQQQDNKKDALKDYVEVNVRIEKFYDKYPEGRIITELVSWNDGVVVMKAFVYRDHETDKPIASGMAYEKEGSTFINKTSALENCETSAVGRALAMAGFEIKKSIASKEEVANAKLNQDQPPVTSKQIGLIKILVEKLVPLGIGKVDSFNLMQLEVGKFRKLEDLTADQASRAIEQLNKLVAQNEQRGA